MDDMSFIAGAFFGAMGTLIAGALLSLQRPAKPREVTEADEDPADPADFGGRGLGGPMGGAG